MKTVTLSKDHMKRQVMPIQQLRNVHYSVALKVAFLKLLMYFCTTYYILVSRRNEQKKKIQYYATFKQFCCL